ncbi:hypothetical protein D3C74_224840 [compost metagenome]
MELTSYKSKDCQIVKEYGEIIPKIKEVLMNEPSARYVFTENNGSGKSTFEHRSYLRIGSRECINQSLTINPTPN